MSAVNIRILAPALGERRDKTLPACDDYFATWNKPPPSGLEPVAENEASK